MLLDDVPASYLIVGLVMLLFLWHHRSNAIGTRPRPDLKNVWPGWTLPFVGDTLRAVEGSGRLLEFALATLEETGETGTFTLPLQRFVFVQKPEWIETSIMKDVLGRGIFAADGDLWHSQRKTTSKIFSANSFRGIIGDSIKTHLATFVNVLEKKADAGEEVNLSDMFFRYTLDTFVRMAFGLELSTMKAEHAHEFATAFDFAQSRIDRRALTPWWRLTEPFTQVGKEMRAAIKTIDKFCYEVIDERDRLDRDGTGEKGTTDLLSLYRGIRDEKGQPLSRKELRDAVLNLIIAGRDTTAQALSWLYFYLITKPELLKPIRKEINEVLGEGEVTYDNFAALVQTKALFYETLRLHPSVPKEVKTAAANDQLPNGGPRIDKGDIVVWSAWAMGRHEAVWGPTARRFDPSRFVEDDGSFKNYPSSTFSSFNHGPRLCLGQTLATFEGISTIVAFTRRFDFSFAPGYLETVEKATGIAKNAGEIDTPLYGNSLTLPPKAAFRVKVTRRSA